MVEANVDTRTLFALAGEKRRQIDGSLHPAKHYAVPLEAKAVYQRAGEGNAIDEYPSVDVGPDHLQKISGAMAEIADVLPEWKSYFTIPIRWRMLTIAGIGSNTSPHIPQSIFFSKKVFETYPALREQVVHEMSHVWLSFTMEIAPWTIESETNFVLPLGTGNKKIWQVILALCFAVSTVKLYRGLIAKGDGRSQHLERLAWASSYAQGCIKTALQSKLLADNGLEIVNACDREINLGRGEHDADWQV